MRVQTYVVIDGVTASGKVKPKFHIYVWRNVNGLAIEVPPDAIGCSLVPEIGMWISIRGRRICFDDALTGEPLFDMEQEGAQRTDTAGGQAEPYAAKLRQMGIDPASLLD